MTPLAEVVWTLLAVGVCWLLLGLATSLLFHVHLTLGGRTGRPDARYYQ